MKKHHSKFFFATIMTVIVLCTACGPAQVSATQILTTEASTINGQSSNTSMESPNLLPLLEGEAPVSAVSTTKEGSRYHYPLHVDFALTDLTDKVTYDWDNFTLQPEHDYVVDLTFHCEETPLEFIEVTAEISEVVTSHHGQLRFVAYDPDNGQPLVSLRIFPTTESSDLYLQENNTGDSIKRLASSDDNLHYLMGLYEVKEDQTLGYATQTITFSFKTSTTKE